MSEENEKMLCLHCKTEMTMDAKPYAIPLAKPRGTEDTTVSVEKSRPVRLFRCPNPVCLSIELKVPTGWPIVSLGPSS